MPKSFLLPLVAGMAAIAMPLAAQDAPAEATEVDYAGFEALTTKVAGIREDRLLSLDEFNTRAARKGALILDTRSASAFARGHIEGAVNLPFSDFTEESLAEAIGANKGRAILIYCNNNFSDNMPPVPLKKAPLALNIPTFINLIGYGYTNVWELGDTVSIADVDWVGTDAEQQLAMLAQSKAALAN